MSADGWARGDARPRVPPRRSPRPRLLRHPQAERRPPGGSSPRSPISIRSERSQETRPLSTVAAAAQELQGLLRLPPGVRAVHLHPRGSVQGARPLRRRAQKRALAAGEDWPRGVASPRVLRDRAAGVSGCRIPSGGLVHPRSDELPREPLLRGPPHRRLTSLGEEEVVNAYRSARRGKDSTLSQ